MSKTKLTPNQIDVLALSLDSTMQDSFVAVTGDTMTGDLLFGDNIDISLGTGGDFRLYHNGANSVLKNITGGVFIESAASTIAVFTQSAAKLYFESSQKLETVTGGVDISGDISITGQVLADDGILSAPGYAFTSSANTGVFYSLGSMKMVTAGVEILKFDNNAMTSAKQYRSSLASSVSSPAFTLGNVTNTGIYSSTGTTLGLTVNSISRLFIDTDGSLSVAGTTNYETLVTADDDIPNKKYVDDEIASISGSDVTVDNYADGTDYTAGTTTALTLSVTPGSENNFLVLFDGVGQHHDQFSLAGAVVTFTSAIPLGVNNVEIVTGASLTVNEPADASVTEAKLASTLSDSLVFNPEITYISKGGHNSFFALMDGRLFSTHGTSAGNFTSTSGHGNTGQCGYYGMDNLKLIAIPTHSPIKKVVGGGRGFAGALLENGDLYVWGSNDNGQLGLGTTTDVGYPVLSTTSVTDVYDHVSNGEYSNSGNKMVILKSDGFLYATGDNTNGQLGVGDLTDRSSWTQVLNITSGTVKSVWNLGAHAGALVVQKTDNTVWVCGNNANGALGNATTTDQTQLIDVTSAWIPSTSYEVKSIAYGGQYYNGTSGFNRQTMGMFSDDGTNQTVRMCGYNGQGQLGDTTTTQRTTPITPTGIPTSGLVEFVGLGSIITVKLLTSAGALWSWGYNPYGQVGDGTATARSTPTTVETGVDNMFDHGPVANTNGFYAQHYILKDDGFVYATGYNGAYYIGDGTTTNATSYTKLILALPNGEIPIDMSSFTTTNSSRVIILLTDANNIYTWGYNSNYGVRDGNSNLHVRVPVQATLPHMK